VGHTNVSAHGRVLAAVLAYGSAAMASHRTAAWVWNLLWDNRTRTDVTVAGRSGKPRRGIILHRPRHVPDEDRTIRDGIPCTSVARVLLDVAGTEPLRLLRRAFEEAERQRVLDMREVERVLATTRGHPGVQPLATLAEEASGPPPMTRSGVEEALRELCRVEGIPLPAMNVPVGEYELDAVWFDEKVAIEIDHYATHGHRTAFERDRVRDIDVHLAGFLPARITDVQIATKPRETAVRLRRLLARGAQVAKVA
jgi:very-short-patch-repair endonuclease